MAYESMIKKEVEVDNDIGEIKAFMRNTAPPGYLICNGASYAVADYPLLTALFQQQFGSKYYFGGSGSTFKVPDLRGEFLRGTGTNAHPWGGYGAAVGVHQMPTRQQRFCMGGSASNNLILYTDSENNADPWINNSDYEDATSGSVRARSIGMAAFTNNTSNSGRFVARPTNTSVLYCIKAG